MLGSKRGTLLRAVAALVASLVLVGCGPEPSPAPTPSASASPSTSSLPVTAPSPTQPEPVDPLPEGPVNALLLGTDSRTPGRMTGNADTIMLAQLSADRETLSLVSITRDSWVEIPGAGSGKVNAALAIGGTELMRATISQLFHGLEIHYVVQTDFEGFIGLTRALDGFEVENQYPTTVTVSSTGRVVDFTADPLLLENTDGLIYVRQRKGLPAGDLDRAERQRAAVIGMLERIDEIAADPAALATLMGHVASRVKITGELDFEAMLALTSMGQQIERDDVISLMAPIEGFGTRGGASMNVVDAAQTAALADALRAGDLRPYVDTFGTAYAP